jgi:putative DNA methylase
MTTADIRLEGKAGQLGAVMTAVVVDGERGKEYRLPTDDERVAADAAKDDLESVFADVPFGVPTEPLPGKEALGFRVPLYGFDQWGKLFTPRQLVALGTFVKHTRVARGAMAQAGYPEEWIEAMEAYLALSLDRVAERNSTICHYDVSRDSISGTFQRYALQISWDYAEACPIGSMAGGYDGQLDWHSCTGRSTNTFCGKP